MHMRYSVLPFRLLLLFRVREKGSEVAFKAARNIENQRDSDLRNTIRPPLDGALNSDSAVRESMSWPVRMIFFPEM